MATLHYAFSLLGIIICAGAANARDIAVCGSSVGHGYYPGAGLRANELGEWMEDSISSGRITLSMADSGDFEVLFSDATGAVVSATRDGATVLRVGQNDFSISVVVIYPLLIETYTFLHSKGGPEVMWTTNKHSTPVPKVGAYHAECTFIDLPNS